MTKINTKLIIPMDFIKHIKFDPGGWQKKFYRAMVIQNGRCKRLLLKTFSRASGAVTYGKAVVHRYNRLVDIHNQLVQQQPGRPAMKNNDIHVLSEGFIAIQVSEDALLLCPNCLKGYVNLRLTKLPEPLKQGQSPYLVDLFHYTYCPHCDHEIFDKDKMTDLLRESQAEEESNEDLENL